MYPYLLIIHSFMRWLVLISLLYAIYRSVKGWLNKATFTAIDDKTRHLTATIAHIQLALGYVLYFNSPMISYFRSNYHEAVKHFDNLFFGMIHITLMTISIILITIGSSVAKRKENSNDKFKTMSIFFLFALLVIFIAIPWPFSPLAHRPLIRTL